VRLLTSILAAAALASSVAVFTAHQSNADPVASAAPSAAASSSPAAPATLTVAVGTKVTFKNSDPVAHTVTAADKSFDSGNLDQNATWSHVFDKAGTYKFICTYHPYMKGTIVVK